MKRIIRNPKQKGRRRLIVSISWDMLRLQTNCAGLLTPIEPHPLVWSYILLSWTIKLLLSFSFNGLTISLSMNQYNETMLVIRILKADHIFCNIKYLSYGCLWYKQKQCKESTISGIKQIHPPPPSTRFFFYGRP